MRTCRRAILYFRNDWLLIAGVVLLDLLFTPAADRTDWIHRLFIQFLPVSPISRIIATAILTLALKFLADATFLIGRTMLNSRIKYNGLARVRESLYAKFQELPLEYHRSRPLGDTI